MDRGSSRRDRLLELACECGATLAGLADAAQLRDSPSHMACGRSCLADSARSVLVLALHHGQLDAELDHYGGRGGTRGNLKLIGISLQVAEQAAHRLDLAARPLDYAPEPNGTFLKDAAALAGLGVIGRNNLLVTPRFGPRIRLCALVLDTEFLPSRCGGLFSPCSSCEAVCQRSCPRQAFVQGTFVRDACILQMETDKRRSIDTARGYPIAYCRVCELSCPVGRE